MKSEMNKSLSEAFLLREEGFLLLMLILRMLFLSDHEK